MAPRPFRVGIKRAYDPPGPDDGRRILVDRLWPRGRSKEALRLDAWLQDLAPSPRLRRWFAHDAAKWPAFRRAYLAELQGAPQSRALERLRAWRNEGPVTLVYAARDPLHNNARVIMELLARDANGPDRSTDGQ